MQDDKPKPLGELRQGHYIEFVPGNCESLVPMIGNTALTKQLWEAICARVDRFYWLKEKGEEKNGPRI